MYEERRNEINWMGIISKILILALFIFVILWLFPMPKHNPLYDQIFNDNIQTMKNAAKSYYTVERLPEKIGDNTKLTLQEMLNKKMLLQFVDKNDKFCDIQNSYVQVTKVAEEEYLLKVLLSCTNQTDYIVETVGCYDVCIDDSCVIEEEKKVVEEKLVQYQFKKPSTKETQSYTCQAGYVLDGKYCYKSLTSTPLKATAIYNKDTTVITNAQKTTEGAYTTYSPVIEVKGNTNYNCPSGSNQSGSGSSIKCTSVDYKPYSVTYSYSCPSGYTSAGSNDSSLKCYKNANVSTSSSWKYSHTETFYKTMNNTSTRRYKVVDSFKVYYCPSSTNCPGLIWAFRYEVYKLSTTTSYSCPEGTRDGSLCYVANIQTTNYVCPGGYTPSGSGTSTQCSTPVSTNPIITIDPSTYKCQDGFDMLGSGAGATCYKHIKGTDKYYCPDANATLNGTKCHKTTKGSLKEYKCPSDYKLSGDKCYKTTTDKTNATLTSKKNTTYTYTWSNHNTLNGWITTGKTRSVGVIKVDEQKEHTNDKQSSENNLRDTYEDIYGEVHIQDNNNTESSNDIKVLDVIIYGFAILGSIFLIYTAIIFFKNQRTI